MDVLVFAVKVKRHCALTLSCVISSVAVECQVFLVLVLKLKEIVGGRPVRFLHTQRKQYIQFPYSGRTSA